MIKAPRFACGRPSGRRGSGSAASGVGVRPPVNGSVNELGRRRTSRTSETEKKCVQQACNDLRSSGFCLLIRGFGLGAPGGPPHLGCGNVRSDGGRGGTGRWADKRSTAEHSALIRLG